MDIFGIPDPDPDPRENLCGSETLIAVEGNILCLTEDSTGATRTVAGAGVKVRLRLPAPAPP